MINEKDLSYVDSRVIGYEWGASLIRKKIVY